MDIIIAIVIGLIIIVAVLVEQNLSSRPNPVDESKDILKNSFESNQLKDLFGDFQTYIDELKKLYEANKEYIKSNTGKEQIGHAGRYNLFKLIEKTDSGYEYIMAYTIVFSPVVANEVYFDWINKRRNLINKFGPIKSNASFLLRFLPKNSIEKTISHFSEKKNSENKDILNYLRINPFTLSIIAGDIKDNWTDCQLQEYFERVDSFLEIVQMDESSRSFSEKLQILYVVYNGLINNEHIKSNDYGKELREYYQLIESKRISLSDLENIVSHIEDTVHDASLSFGGQGIINIEAEVCTILKNKFKEVLNQISFDNITKAESILNEIQDCYQDYSYRIRVNILKKQCEKKVSKEQESVFNAICNSKDIILSIAELKTPNQHQYFFNWFLPLIEITSTFANQFHSAEEVFKECYSQYIFVLNQNDSKRVTTRKIFEIQQSLKRSIEYEDEQRKVLASDSDDTNDPPYYGMTHPTKCLNDYPEFDFRTALLNMKNCFSSHNKSNTNDILLFFPHVKLLRGKRISSFQVGCGQVYRIKYFVQTEDNTRKIGFPYETDKLQKGERSLLSSLDFVPSKEGVWEFLLLVSLRDSSIITSKSSVPGMFSRNIKEGAFLKWDFTPKIFESKDSYFVELVKYSFAIPNASLVYMRYSIGKEMPHTVSFKKIDSVSVNHNIKIFY